MIFFWLALSIKWDDYKLKTFIAINITVSLIVSIFVFTERFHLFYFLSLPEGRLYNFFGYQNLVAQYLIITCLLGTGMIFSVKNNQSKVFIILSTVLSFLALFLTFCRGALLGLCIGIFVFVMLLLLERNHKLHNKIKLLLAALGLLIIVPAILILFSKFGLISRGVYDLWLSMFTRGNTFRFTYWMDTIRMITDHFFMGVGLGNYYIYYPIYNTGTGHWITRYAHNDILHIMAETGLIGISGFLVFVYFALRKSIKIISGLLSTKNGFLYYGLFCGIIATLVHSMLSYNLQVATPSFLFFVSLGILLSKDFEKKVSIGKFKWSSLKSIVVTFVIILSGFLFVNEYKIIKAHYYTGKSLLLFQNGERKAGMELISKAVALQPHNSKYNYILGQKYLEVNLLDEAVVYFEKAHKLEPYSIGKKKTYERTKELRDLFRNGE